MYHLCQSNISKLLPTYQKYPQAFMVTCALTETFTGSVTNSPHISKKKYQRECKVRTLSNMLQPEA
jgi:hypothetical protein